MNKHTPVGHKIHHASGLEKLSLREYIEQKQYGVFVLDINILAEAAIWGAMAALSWNFPVIVSRFPNFFLNVQSTGVGVPSLYGRIVIATLACWEVLINAAQASPVPPFTFLLLSGFWLYRGWAAEGEEHLQWLAVYASMTAVVLVWQCLGV